ncbi:MAG: YCF48-related protein [Gammaproteobacteria bacterium]|nr:YCF48-related protein [Gammaproteobacteria bacterium]MDH5304598.1 YCF48-related protein [Gammaproteobacteria bacterium]
MQAHHLIFAALIALGHATPAWSQATAGMKGIWEPVNYSEDLKLTDVFFVTPETGYVAGDAATILKTSDAGASWTPLLGGDPASTERAIKQLYFVSPTAGWATQVSGKTNLFRTRDGDSWERIGIIDEHYEDFAFSSESNGVFINDNLVYRTQDAGKTWKQVHQCKAKVAVDGLPRQVDCRLYKLRVVSPTIIYAFGGVYPGTAALLVKSVDGGANWSVVSIVADEQGSEGGLFFVDENTGFFSTAYGKSAFRTTDGGQTWSGIPATQVFPRMAFADPEVGWSMLYSDLSFTTDGGRRWSSRRLDFPAFPNAFSLPRRDVAYAVGDHGMIYRYRIVPESAPNPPYSVAMVPMPPLANGVIEQLGELEAGLDTMEASFEATDSWPADDSGSWVETNYPDFEDFEQGVDYVSSGLPALGSKHRNLNLLIEGLKLFSDLSAQGSGLKQAFANLREARDADSVAAALLELSTQVEASRASVQSFRDFGVAQ